MEGVCVQVCVKITLFVNFVVNHTCSERNKNVKPLVKERVCACVCVCVCVRICVCMCVCVCTYCKPTRRVSTYCSGLLHFTNRLSYLLSRSPPRERLRGEAGQGRAGRDGRGEAKMYVQYLYPQHNYSISLLFFLYSICTTTSV